MARKKPRNKVFLIAYDKRGEIVEKCEMTYEQYYDEINPIVDSDAYHAKKGIRRLTGEIYGYKGNLQQSFEVEYDEDGHYLRGRGVHEDGTITEN
jgi:hypothetical protein